MIPANSKNRYKPNRPEKLKRRDRPNRPKKLNKPIQCNLKRFHGTIDSIDNILEKTSISEVIVTSDHIPKEKLDRLSMICSSLQISLRRFQTRLEEIPTG